MIQQPSEDYLAGLAEGKRLGAEEAFEQASRLVDRAMTELGGREEHECGLSMSTTNRPAERAG